LPTSRFEQAGYLRPDVALPRESPEGTVLLPQDIARASSRYRLGIIGMHDRTLEPRIPGGSIVQIDTYNREISPARVWSHEFQRPIYFLLTQDAYVCGWCELDSTSEWLTLVPHPLSTVKSRRWKYRTEIETIGKVIAMQIRVAP
jgi:hypothetical protein